MRKIIVTEMITLDGVMQGPGGVGEDTSEGFEYSGWSVPYGDEVGGEFVLKELEQTADYILGRTTFDIWAGFWPKHADIWPGINDGTKYVMSKNDKKTDLSAGQAGWKNTVFIDSLEDIKKLKNGDGPDIQVWGSSQIVQLLFKNDLVDKLVLKTYPLTLGTGKKLFRDGTIPAVFKLRESLMTSTGVIIATYERAGEVKTGTVEA